MGAVRKTAVKKGPPKDGPPYSEPVQYKRTLAAATLALNDLRTLWDTLDNNRAVALKRGGEMVTYHPSEIKAVLDHLTEIIEALREGIRGKF